MDGGGKGEEEEKRAKGFNLIKEQKSGYARRFDSSVLAGLQGRGNNCQ